MMNDLHFHRFLRADRENTESQQESYRLLCAAVWQKQASALSNPVEPEEEDEPEDEDVNFLDAADPLKSFDSKVQVTEADDKKAYDAFAKEMAGSEKKSQTTNGEFSVMPVGGGRKAVIVTSDRNVNISDFHRPEKVVKRITRTFKADGTEIVEVQFIVSEMEVARVEREVRRREKMLNVGVDRADSSSSSIPQNVKNHKKKKSSSARDQDSDYDDFDDSGAVMLKLSKIKKKV